MNIAFVGSLGTPELVLILLVGSLVTFVGVMPFWIICKKAGLSPWIWLIILVPFGVLVLPILLAVLEWPSLKKPS